MPNIRIVDNSPVEFRCGQTRTLTVEYTVFNLGEGKVCVELLSDLPCRFRENSSKQICKPFNATAIGVPMTEVFHLTMDCDPPDEYFSSIHANVTDAQGEGKSTSRTLTVFCRKAFGLNVSGQSGANLPGVQ